MGANDEHGRSGCLDRLIGPGVKLRAARSARPGDCFKASYQVRPA